MVRKVAPCPARPRRAGSARRYLSHLRRRAASALAVDGRCIRDALACRATRMDPPEFGRHCHPLLSALLVRTSPSSSPDLRFLARVTSLRVDAVGDLLMTVVVGALEISTAFARVLAGPSWWGKRLAPHRMVRDQRGMRCVASGYSPDARPGGQGLARTSFGTKRSWIDTPPPLAARADARIPIPHVRDEQSLNVCRFPRTPEIRYAPSSPAIVAGKSHHCRL